MNQRLKALGVFSIVMITVGSVDSIRNLPATALFGSSLIFFFLLGALFFLVPCALVSAELSSAWTKEGGVYVWVKEAFGRPIGFMAIWFQWIENVIWYPTILSFVAGTLGYLIAPSLAENKYFLMTVILVCFWGATIINLFGMKSSARFASFCTITGLMIPMALIIALGVAWVAAGEPLNITFDKVHMLPNFHDSDMWVALIGIMLSFCGMEIATVHVCDTKDPQKTYPIALLYSCIIILATLILGSLAIAVVLPHNQISLVAGIMEAFTAFFQVAHMQWVLPVIAVMLVIGGMGGVSNWIIAPTRGLLIAAQDGNLPEVCQRQNRFGAPSALLIYQAVIVSFLTMVFLLMPSVNGSYWLLTALAAQLYMIMYVLMFAAGLYLRYSHPDQERAFRVPGGNWGMWLAAGAGVVSSVATLVIGFFPPGGIDVGGTAHYEELLTVGLVLMSLPPFLLYWYKPGDVLAEA